MTDAVLWALGEQSPVAVRGQSMQDVIFGGVPGRPAPRGPPAGSRSSGYVCDTGSTPVGDQSGGTDVSWDYSWFDQDEADAQFTGLVDQLVAAIAAAYSIPEPAMAAVMLLQRTWTLELNVQGNGAPYALGLTSAGQGYVPQLVETMAYPPAQDQKD